MSLLVAIAAALISAFGLLTLIADWAEKAGKPQRWIQLDRSRRSFILLGASLALGTVVGSGTKYFAWRKSRVLYLLFDLEVILAQLEGLANVAIAQQDVVRTLEPIRVIVKELGEYGFKAARLMSRLEQLVPEAEYKQLRYGAMSITVGLDRLDQPDPSKLDSRAVNESLITMQSGIRSARSAARRMIYERTST